MKLILYFFLFLFLLPLTFAETPIFSGKVITGQEKVIDGNIFKFTYDEASNKTFVQTPTQSMIVENGKCKSNGVFRVCVNSADYYDRNITTYVTYYQVDAAIYKLTGSLSAVSTANPSSFLQHEYGNVTITITNPTDVDVSNIAYNENLTGFAIISTDGCTLKENGISWSGSLASGYKKICTATIIAEKEGTYNLAGSLSYFNGFEAENKATDTLTITVLPQQLAVVQLADSNVELQQPFYINVSLQNINKYEQIVLSITVDIPWNFELLNKLPYFSKDINILKSDSRMEPGSAFNYSLRLKGNAESKIPIKQRFEYTIKGISYTIENYTFVNPAEPKPIINFSTEYNEVSQGQEFIVAVKVRNPSRIYELTDIKARLNAPYNNEIEQNLDKLIPKESYAIISNTLIAPKNSDTPNGTIKLEFNIEYKFDGTAKSLNKSLELKLKPANGTSNLSTAAKTNIQSPPEIKTTAEPKLLNKTSGQAEAKTEMPKSGFFNNKIMLFGAVIFAVFLIIVIIINKIRKKEATAFGKEKEQAATQEAEEIKPVPKPEESIEAETKEIEAKKPRKQGKSAKKN